MRSLVLFIALALPFASSLCTYTCWDVAHNANTWAACTTTATIPINFGDHTFVEEVHDGTLCGTCAHETDRRKGMFVSLPGSWTWIAFKDLYNGRPCGAGGSNDQFFKQMASGKQIEVVSDNFLAGCLSPGMYTPKTYATVRGKAGVEACHDQAQYLGTLEHGQDFHVTGQCGDCVWCSGNAGYPISQEQTTVLCSDLQAK